MILDDVIDLRLQPLSIQEPVMSQSEPKRILLVEDYDPVRELTANVLEDRGYRVSTVPGGADARFPAD